MLACLLSAGILTGGGLEFKPVQMITFAALLWVSSIAPRFRNCATIPFSVILSLYFPVGFIYGIPSEGQIASLFATDPLEAREFFQTIPLAFFLAPPLLIAGVFLFYRLQSRWGLAPSVASQSRAGKAAGIGILVACLAIAWACKDFRPLSRGVKNLKAVIVSNYELRHIDRTTVWKITGVHPEHRISLLVINESVRRDYMHAYGYPVGNTPYMESMPGRIYEGLESEGDNTVAALKKALTYTGATGKDVDYTMNVIDLAREAGYSTAWFSNQGILTKHDTPITAIASGADQKVWLKYGRNGSKNFYDTALLPLIEKEIARKDDRPKLIVAHLQGSHPLICDRLSDKSGLITTDPKYIDIACYAETIRESDKWLKSAREMLEKSGESFSLLYFSDHGLSTNTIKGAVTLKHGPSLGNHRDVPLYMSSSEDKGIERIRGRRYGRNLTEGVMAWLGITTEQVPHPRPLFRPESDTNAPDLEALIKERPADPAIDLTALGKK